MTRVKLNKLIPLNKKSGQSRAEAYLRAITLLTAEN